MPRVLWLAAVAAVVMFAAAYGATRLVSTHKAAPPAVPLTPAAGVSVQPVSLGALRPVHQAPALKVVKRHRAPRPAANNAPAPTPAATTTTPVVPTATTPLPTRTVTPPPPPAPTVSSGGTSAPSSGQGSGGGTSSGGSSGSGTHSGSSGSGVVSGGG